MLNRTRRVRGHSSPEYISCTIERHRCGPAIPVQASPGRVKDDRLQFAVPFNFGFNGPSCGRSQFWYPALNAQGIIENRPLRPALHNRMEVHGHGIGLNVRPKDS